MPHEKPFQFMKKLLPQNVTIIDNVHERDNPAYYKNIIEIILKHQILVDHTGTPVSDNPQSKRVIDSVLQYYS